MSYICGIEFLLEKVCSFSSSCTLIMVCDQWLQGRPVKPGVPGVVVREVSRWALESEG